LPVILATWILSRPQRLLECPPGVGASPDPLVWSKSTVFCARLFCLNQTPKKIPANRNLRSDPIPNKLTQFQVQCVVQFPFHRWTYRQGSLDSGQPPKLALLLALEMKLTFRPFVLQWIKSMILLFCI